MNDQKLTYNLDWLVDTKGLDEMIEKVGKFENVLGRVKGAILGAFAGFAVNRIFDNVNAMRAQENQLVVITGSLDAATAKLAEFQEASKRTTDGVNTLRNAFTALGGHGINTTGDELAGLSRLALGVGGDLESMAKQINRIAIGGRGRGLSALLGTKVNVDGKNIMFEFNGEIIKTTEGVEGLVQELARLGNSNFDEAVARKQKTIEYGSMRLRESLKKLSVVMGSQFDGEVGGLYVTIAEILDSFQPVVESLGKGIAVVARHVRTLAKEVKNSALWKLAEDLEDKFDVIEKIPIVLAMIATGIAAMKVGIGLKTLLGTLTGISMTATIAAAKVALLVAAAALIVFAIEDIYFYLTEGDSAMGRFVDKFKDAEGMAGDIARALEWFKDNKQIIGDIFKFAIESGKEYIAFMFRTFSRVLKLVGSVISELWNIVKGLFVSIGNIIDALIALFKGDFDGFFEYLGLAFENAARTIENIFIGVVNVIISAFKSAVDFLLDGVRVVLRSIDRAGKFIGKDLNLEQTVDLVEGLAPIRAISDFDGIAQRGYAQPGDAVTNIGSLNAVIQGSAAMNERETVKAVEKGIKKALNGPVDNLRRNYGDDDA